ncbi:conserved hypothetical protein [Theileria orientalis strain Shintoku]|uniref:Glideosome associated protein with multiple membrane spans 2 n=1 Tax=Theileria orientalis strain Shintoku TaxID=869250 RepID=J4C2T6_THEOR|nr:conserved hypothetical protein [Theileria orientalis strain Shintoku]PVC50753.1 hypothetical protein MACL_00002037 [Theileria orientalis]BAM39256.1 conserved hypothetical protein [Theileria orientalis strain Shintoku]|eukprot:XP_009689557.1 conserved hypothetical protein [Theileria orientalis strain Shintoku]
MNNMPFNDDEMGNVDPYSDGYGYNTPQPYDELQYNQPGPVDPDYMVEAASPRGEAHTPFVGFFSSKLLRSGFTLQTVSLSLMFVFYWAFGGTGVFVFDLYAAPESVKVSKPFHLTVSALMGLYLLGTLYIAMFQVFVTDNSKSVRGFRAGSKILSAAVTLDLLSNMLRLVEYLYAYFYMSMKWWTKYQQTKSDWIFFQFGSFTNSFALVMYGAALFYLEAYHDEGTSEEVAWTNLSLFFLAGLAELLMVFTGYGALFSLFLLLANFSGTLWAFSFEPLLGKWAPSLHSRDVNADFVNDDTVVTEPYTQFYPGQNEVNPYLNMSSYPNEQSFVQYPNPSFPNDPNVVYPNQQGAFEYQGNFANNYELDPKAYVQYTQGSLPHYQNSGNLVAPAYVA